MLLARTQPHTLILQLLRINVLNIWEVATKSSWCGSGVVRSHPPMAVALASTGKEGLPLYHQTAVFYDRSHLRDARSTGEEAG